jgi:hypothetical protein
MRLTRADDAVALYSPLDVSSPDSRGGAGRDRGQSRGAAGLAGAAGGHRMGQLLAPPGREEEEEEEVDGNLTNG